MTIEATSPAAPVSASRMNRRIPTSHTDNGRRRALDTRVTKPRQARSTARGRDRVHESRGRGGGRLRRAAAGRARSRFALAERRSELGLGILIGPSVLGWAHADEPVRVLALLGLSFLLLIAGLEVDCERLRGRLLRLTGLGFAASVAIGLALGLALKGGGVCAPRS
jgi:hypothetical protein